MCVEAVKGSQSWRGQVQVYTDNSVLSLCVILSGGESASQISVSRKAVQFPPTCPGTSATSSLSLTNTQQSLVQWWAVMEPSFFSISQSSGLLNPAQSVQLGLTFKPAAVGQHSAALSLSHVAVRGGQEPGEELILLLFTHCDWRFHHLLSCRDHGLVKSCRYCISNV